MTVADGRLTPLPPCPPLPYARTHRGRREEGGERHGLRPTALMTPHPRPLSFTPPHGGRSERGERQRRSRPWRVA